MSTENIIEVDPDFLELAPTYLERRITECQKLEAMCKASDFSAIEFIGHQMKGNAAVFNLQWLGNKGEQLEDAAIARDQATILRLKDEMVRFLATIKFVAEEP